MANYVSAVRCLSEKPSKLNPEQNDTLYDDFAFVHVRLDKTCECFDLVTTLHHY
jgi:hypothetical protein